MSFVVSLQGQSLDIV